MNDDANQSDVAKPLQIVKSRLVLNFPGFEKTDSEAQLGRILHGALQTGKFWQFSVEQNLEQDKTGDYHSIADHTTQGGNWQTETRVVQFRWNDIVHVYENATYPMGFLRDAIKFAAFFSDGTVGRYFKASPRYFGFTIFPLLFAIIIASLCWIVAGYFTSSILLKAAIVLLGTLILCKWPGSFVYVPLTIADWGFARDMVNQSNGDIEARFDSFAETLQAEISNSSHDEIVVVGHSFGAVWAIAALSKALQKNPQLLIGRQLSFLALGSSIAKIALAPRAEFLREHVSKVVSQKDVFWHEIQTKDDWIAFYKAEPMEILNINPACDVRVDRVRFSKGIEKKRYRSIRMSFYRTHRQYILYYDKRINFDYMLRLFGPFGVRDLAYEKDVPSRIDNRGMLV